jgi:cholesterol transport system auxiliary component
MSMRFAAFVLVFVASGCVSVLPKASPPPARFEISDVATADAGAPVVWTLGVEEPLATRAIDTTKIALMRAPGAVEYFAGAEWSDRAPRLFGVALVRSFENSGRISGVGSRVTLPVSDYVLQTDVRALIADMSGDGVTARTAIYAKLTNGRSKIYAAKLFSAERAIADDEGDDAAAALNQNLSALIAEIRDFAFAEAEKAEAARRAAN